MASSTSSPTPLSESNFAKAYLHLLHSAADGKPPGFKPTHLASQVQNVAREQHLVTVGKMPAPKRKVKRASTGGAGAGSGSGSGGAGGETKKEAKAPGVDVTVKSIKGVKFEHTLRDVPPSMTVLELKHELALADQKEKFGLSKLVGGVAAAPETLRVLVRGKVVADSKAVGELVGDVAEGKKPFVAVVVMASPASAASSTAAAAAKDPEDGDVEMVDSPPVVAASIEIDDALWKEIGDVLAKKLGKGGAEKALKKLKQGYEAK